MKNRVIIDSFFRRIEPKCLSRNPLSEANEISMRCLVVNSIFLLFLVVASLAEAGVLPWRITTHSQLTSKVQEADQVRLKIEGEALPAALTWTILGRTVCEGNSCNIDTATLGVGTHKVVLTVVGEIDGTPAPGGAAPGGVFPGVKRRAHQRIEFNLEVREREPGNFASRDKIEVPMVPAFGANGNITEISPYYIARSSGFVSFQPPGRKRQHILEGDQYSLAWNESITTKVKSLARFGQKGIEELFCLPESRVALGRDHYGQRTLTVSKGAARLRQLQAIDSDPLLAIIEGHFAVERNVDSDLIVERGDNQTTLTVLRGAIRVHDLIRSARYLVSPAIAIWNNCRYCAPNNS
jgi:hypothetical protein